jgi:8-oxo-dGTP diphosphatase
MARPFRAKRSHVKEKSPAEAVARASARTYPSLVSRTVNDPPAAVSVALTDNGRILLVRRGRAPAAGLLAFPGGRVEPGESLEQAARRELNEETGLSAGRLRLHSIHDLPAESAPGATAFRLHVFAGDGASGELAAADDAAEAGWYGPGEIERDDIIASCRDIARALLDHNRKD